MSSPRRILIVGFGAAGLDAAISARKTDRNADVKAITLEDKPPYSRCGLPFVIGGEIQDFDRLLIFQSSFYKMMKIDVKLKTKATEVDVKSKTVRIEDGAGREENLQYDCLILATGAESNILNVKGVEKKGIYSMRTMRDASAILEASRSANRAVVIGGGEIALEAADALKKRGLHVTVMVRSRLLRIVLDEDMGQIVHKRVVESGVDLVTGKVPEEYTGDEYVKGIVAQGEETKADLVVLAAGAHPNTDLAHKIGCQIGSTGGIIVSRRMETTVENVYSAGDCVECTHLVTGKPTLSMLGTSAVRQGKVAGINAVGGYALFPGVLRSTITTFFDIQVGCTGLTSWQAKAEGLEPAVGTVSWKTRAEYYPGAKEIRVRVVAEKKSRRIVGAQIIGGEDVTSKIDALSVAIQSGMTTYDLANVDTCYTPPLADTWSPLVLAGEDAMRRV